MTLIPLEEKEYTIPKTKKSPATKLEKWTQKLSALNHFDLIHICEGQLTYPPTRSSRLPYINLRIKEAHLQKVYPWTHDSQNKLSKRLVSLFHPDETCVELDMKFVFKNHFPHNRQDVFLKVNYLHPRNSEHLDQRTSDWFDETIGLIERFDQFFGTFSVI
ncbi:MAG: hypothetical protein AB7W47_08480 [Calditrichaceae bacterium]